MQQTPQIPAVPLPPQPPVDPVQRSIAKPDAFAKPAALKAKAAPKQTRVRTMDWKRTRGRPRKRPMDPRNVHFF